MDDLAVRLAPDLFERYRDAVHRTGGDGLARRVGRGVPDRRDGPFDGAAAGLRNRRHVLDRVVQDLLAQGSPDVLAVAADWRRRADVGARSHVGKIGGHGDERAGTGGPAAARGDPYDRRERRLQQRGHDPLGGIERPARRVQLHDQGRRIVGVRPRDRLLDVAGHDAVDDAGRRDDVHGSARIAGGCRSRARLGSRSRREADRAHDDPGEPQRADQAPGASDAEVANCRSHRGSCIIAQRPGNPNTDTSAERIGDDAGPRSAHHQAGGREGLQAWAVSPALGSAFTARPRARWRAALARFPQVAMSHQRRRLVREAS